MMKNKKLLIVFILILAFLLVMVTYTKATDNVDELPIIDINTENQENSTNNDQSNNETNNNAENTNTNTNTNINTNTNTNTNTNSNTDNNNVLPQTGVQGDTALIIFIIICIISAIYAYFKIRKYKNVN